MAHRQKPGIGDASVKWEQKDRKKMEVLSTKDIQRFVNLSVDSHISNSKSLLNELSVIECKVPEEDNTITLPGSPLDFKESSVVCLGA